MQNFIKTIINAVQSWTKKEIREEISSIPVVQPDWNENDSSSDNYIKNKPNVALQSDINNISESFNDVFNNLGDKMDATNPIGTGSFSMNRRSGTTVGYYSHAEGTSTTASGGSSHAEGSDTTASGGSSHAEGSDTTASGGSSHAEGYNTTASGSCSHAEGSDTTASGSYSHAEGYFARVTSLSASADFTTSTTPGYAAHAEGYGTVACGAVSHAEGNGTKASGSGSHAEGTSTTASGGSSHAEGSDTTASGGSSHAEGYNTTASGGSSHAEGYNTTAQTKSQHVQGEYNILDAGGTPTTRGKYAHIVGNGTSTSARSNAHTLDWSGIGWFQGGLQVGGNAQDDGAKNVMLEGEAIPVPTTATVGQVLMVKAVDENGKPTEWEAVDSMVVASSTDGSTKKFKITVDDSGVLSATEVVEEATTE